MKSLCVCATFMLLALLTGCTTMHGVTPPDTVVVEPAPVVVQANPPVVVKAADPSPAPTPAPTPAPAPAPVPPPAKGKTPIQGLINFGDWLSTNPLFQFAGKDSNDTLVWIKGTNANGQPNVPSQLDQATASVCPTMVNLAIADFQSKWAGVKAQLQVIDAKFNKAGTDMQAGQPPIELILLNTQIRYGGGGTDPRAQLQSIKDDMAKRVAAVVNGCQNTIPYKQINDNLIKPAVGAGLIAVSAGGATPFLGPIMGLVP